MFTYAAYGAAQRHALFTIAASLNLWYAVYSTLKQKHPYEAIIIIAVLLIIVRLSLVPAISIII